MRTSSRLLLLGAALVSAPLAAQETTVATATTSRDTTKVATKDTTTTASDSAKAKADAAKSGVTISVVPTVEIQHLRANDQRGINVFEAPKNDGVPYTGFKLGFGAAFTQQFQGLGHQNTAAPKMVAGATAGAPQTNANQLIQIGHGFNNAVANLYVNAQLARGSGWR